jgi:hypothetical protein
MTSIFYGKRAELRKSDSFTKQCEKYTLFHFELGEDQLRSHRYILLV